MCHRISAKMKTLHCMKCQLKALDYGLIHLVGKLKEIMGDKEKEKGTSGDSKTEKGKQKNGTLDKEETSRYKVLHDGSNNLSKEERAEQEQMEDERIMERLTEALEEGLKGTPGGFILLEQKLLFV